MGSLINPIGWRVKYRRYWAVNFLVNDHSFMFSYHFQRQLFEVISSLLRHLNLKDLSQELSLFHPMSFNIHMFKNSVYLLVRLRFFRNQFWRLLPEKKIGIRYLKARYFKKRKSRRRFKQPVRLYKKLRRGYRSRKRLTKKGFMSNRYRFIKKRIYARITKRHQKYTRLIINRPDPFLTPPKYRRVPRKLWIAFLVLPYLIYMKTVLQKVISIKLCHPSTIRIFFLGVNQRSINASLLIDFIAQKLEQRRFRISRLLYDALRILRRLVKTQRLGGYKLLMAGRFSRRDRATYIWKGYSSIPLSTKVTSIDYQYRYLQMRYSLGIFKLWINRI